LDNINLFSLITVMSFFLLAPFALLKDGGLKFTPHAIKAMGIMDVELVMKRTILAGFCFHAYQQVPLMASLRTLTFSGLLWTSTVNALLGFQSLMYAA
jgi:hypothetical protein